jgi:DNA-binding NarL/FixJ family response regulator
LEAWLVARTSALAGIGADQTAILLDALGAAASNLPADLATFNVAELGRLSPELLVCDMDDQGNAGFEKIRQIRFVLPACLIIVFTNSLKSSWAVAAHLAGANAIVSKRATLEELIVGIKTTVSSGCYTDHRFHVSEKARLTVTATSER